MTATVVATSTVAPATTASRFYGTVIATAPAPVAPDSGVSWSQFVATMSAKDVVSIPRLPRFCSGDMYVVATRMIRQRREAEQADAKLWRTYTQRLAAWREGGGGAQPRSPESDTATRAWYAAVDAARAAPAFSAVDDRIAVRHDALYILASEARMNMTRALLRALDEAWLAR